MSDLEDETGALLDAIALPKLAGGSPLVHASGRGRAKLPLTYTITREVTEADLAALAQGIHVGAPQLVSINARHHRIAQMLADGMTQTAVAAAVSMTLVRVNVIANDPLFKPLYDYYLSQKEGIYLDVHSRLADLGSTAGDILQNRMEDSPEAFENRELKEIMEAAFDRSVTPAKGSQRGGQSGGPLSVQVSVNFVSPKEAPKELGTSQRSEPLVIEGVEVKTIEDSSDGNR